MQSTLYDFSLPFALHGMIVKIVLLICDFGYLPAVDLGLSGVETHHYHQTLQIRHQDSEELR